MSWVPLIREQVANGFNILDDLAPDVTWKNRTNPQFSDGEYTYTEVDSLVPAVRADFESRLIDGEQVRLHDFQLIVQQSDVDNLTPDDLFTVSGRVYKVVDYEADPASVTFTIHLRPV